MKIESVVGQNITIVFDALDLSIINRESLRGFIETPNRPTIMDSPEVLVAVFPLDAGVVILQFGDRRLRITAPNAVDEIGTYPLWTYASSSSTLIPEGKFTPIAYGFNYDVKAVLEDRDPRACLNSVFFRDINLVVSAVGDGQAMSIVPRLRYERDGLRHDLLLEPAENQLVKVHLNIHRQLDGEALPAESSLEYDYRRRFEYLDGVLKGLFAL